MEVIIAGTVMGSGTRPVSDVRNAGSAPTEDLWVSRSADFSWLYSPLWAHRTCAAAQPDTGRQQQMDV